MKVWILKIVLLENSKYEIKILFLVNGKCGIRWNFAIGARTKITYGAYNIPKSGKKLWCQLFRQQMFWSVFRLLKFKSKSIIKIPIQDLKL